MNHPERPMNHVVLYELAVERQRNLLSEAAHQRLARPSPPVTVAAARRTRFTSGGLAWLRRLVRSRKLDSSKDEPVALVTGRVSPQTGMHEHWHQTAGHGAVRSAEGGSIGRSVPRGVGVFTDTSHHEVPAASSKRYGCSE
jgi:hypothetical protein